MSFSESKKFFFYTLIVSLIISAVVAVVAVLFGEFNEKFGKVFLTLFMFIIHSFVLMIFTWEDEHQGTSSKFGFFSGVLFLILVFSIISSILGVWEILDSETIGKIYSTYFLMGFASLHGNILAKAFEKETYLDLIIFVNYLFMTIVVLMLLPIIFMSGQFIQSLGDFFPRVLAAAAIIDGTLTILVIIFYNLYMHKHPRTEGELYNEASQNGRGKKGRGLSIWVWILLIILFFQIILPLFLRMIF